MSISRLSLAQQIALLDEPTPLDVDPEDEQRGSPVPHSVEAREHYLQVGPSDLRRQLDSVADPKYIGVKTSRKQLLDEDAVGSDFQDSPDLSNSESQSVASGASTSEEDNESLSQSEEDSNKVGEFLPPTKDAPKNANENDLSNTIRQRRDEDKKKGRAVSKQLSLWDSLLDARIRLQKSVIASNRLPPPTQISDFMSDRRCLEARHVLLGEVLALNRELSTLRDELTKEDKEVQWKRRRVGDGIEGGRRYAVPEIDNVDRDWDALIREASEDAAGLEHAYHPYLTRTLAKWSTKVAAVAPSALLPASRKKFSQAGSVKSVGAQIEEVLQSDWPVLVSRTQLKRSKGSRVTSKRGSAFNDDEDEEVEDVEVFDDTDFYQQLLRDVIDAKGGSAGRVDWMASQRQKKSKKHVDTKASKGRKLRYEVHEKIQNFMVPVPVAAGAWHEAQIDELFGSLLGKGFED
ncbi:apoptosis-antagonizing transcription factor [Lactarius akahatsu]|uniref:Protein BFR2 n=1 Tax=Lactarius akahatsu TaxID=416441 RepID=A0AAD4QHM1_9AGAM|nr:apoptosis-antagonizing transcription factor [Lactarius akahatsu]